MLQIGFLYLTLLLLLHCWNAPVWLTGWPDACLLYVAWLAEWLDARGKAGDWEEGCASSLAPAADDGVNLRHRTQRDGDDTAR